MALHEPRPSLEEVKALLKHRGDILPIFVPIHADCLTPVAAYLKLAQGATHSFLLESVIGGENLARYSFVGADPYKVLSSKDGQGDPLIALEREMKDYNYIKVQGSPPFTGGAIGYAAYDCVRYFEPRTARYPLKDVLGMPDSLFMFCDTILVFDHIYSIVQLVTHVRLTGDDKDVDRLYSKAISRIERLQRIVRSEIPYPVQEPIKPNRSFTSNVGKEGYEGFVTRLKTHIRKGDIIQAVPSQRISRPTSLHPFNIYRYLRTVNPSPYMFYIDCEDFKIIGASPETLVKIENRHVITHPIAGTTKRGSSQEEDERLAKELLASEKDRAEHVMLVDLARNDVNRVCQPKTVKVDSLMEVQKFSHVMHIVSQVSGVLQENKTRFDAFRSIFPAGTVSGAPKVRAMELIAELEGEKRGVYAGAVGRFNFDHDSMDTCIAIRTMVYKNETVYLQAGGGIVYDSVEEDEYVETLNKLRANLNCISQAEEYYRRQEVKPT